MRGLSRSLLLLALASGCGETAVETAQDVAEDPSSDALIADREAPFDAPIDVTDASVRFDALDAAQGDAAARVDGAEPDAVRRDVPREATADAPREASVDASMDASGFDAPEGGGRCPSGMALVASRVCVDRWEASLEEVSMDAGVRDWSPYESVEGHRVRAVSRGDVVPQGYISGEQAQAACGLSGKRLCRLDEWMAACRGPSLLSYPYGNTYARRRCNEARTPHPVVQFYGTSVGVFTYARMNNPGINMLPDSLAHTGQFAECVSPWGVFDMVGNLHEWIDDPAGTFKGGFYVDAEINGHGCLYTTSAHALSYHDYSTGFRCCADPTP